MTGENLINYQPAMIETLEPLIELRGISKTFGNNKVLDNVDLKIYRGQALGIIGPRELVNQQFCGL